VHVLRSYLCLAVIGLTFAIYGAQPSRASERGADRSAQTVPPIYVGSRKIATPAFFQQQQLFVPVRGVFEAIDANVAFTPPRFIVVRKDGAVIAAFILDRTRAIVGHRAVDLDAAPTRRDGVVYVPLRVVAQAAGATVAYTSRPPAVHIRQSESALSDTLRPDPTTPEVPSTARWRMGVEVFTGICCFGCLVLTARRFAPTLFRAGPKRSAVPPPDEPQNDGVSLPAPDRVALSSVEATGEARLHKKIIKETRTIQVAVTREELVIEYAGDGGVVLINGRELASGELVRIPLWEERVNVDITKHILLEEDIVVEKRRSPAWSAPQSEASADLGIAEGSPS
jgi:uncharacterized protein (TIGR02271 family)